MRWNASYRVHEVFGQSPTGPKRAETRARRAAEPLFAETPPAKGRDLSDARRFALAATSWSEGDRRGVRLEPGLDGDEEMIVGRLLAAVRGED